MTKEIIFHLGDYKTGSTSIQRILSEQNFTIPGRRVLFTAVENHMDMARCLNPGSRFFSQQKQIWTRHAKMILKSEADIAVISAENMNHVKPQQLKEAVERYFSGFTGRIRYITYLRPHADRIVSSFAERRKLGQFFRGLVKLHEEMEARKRLYFMPRFTEWREVMGPEFHLRPMVRSHLFNGDVVHDFFRFVCEDEGFEIHGDTNRNVSLSMAELLAISEMQREITRIGGRGYATEELRHRTAHMLQEALSQLPRNRPAEKPRLHRRLAQRIRATYEADAAAMDAAFFEGTPLSDALAAAPAKAVEKPQSLRLGDYYDDDMLRLLLAMSATIGASLLGQGNIGENSAIATRLDTLRPPMEEAPSAA